MKTTITTYTTTKKRKEEKKKSASMTICGSDALSCKLTHGVI